MKYDELMESVSAIVENDKIIKENLIFIYELESKNHKKMQETFFYKSNEPTAIFIPTEEFEVQFGDMMVKFVKKSTQTD